MERAGRRTDWERLDEIIIGVLTAREIEQLDESAANLLHDINGEVDKMKWEWRKKQG